MKTDLARLLKTLLNALGPHNLNPEDPAFGPRSTAAYNEELSKLLKKNPVPAPTPKPVPGTIAPVYPKPGPFHPRFETLLPAPYTHLHPIDILRSVAGEKEILGVKDNPLIAHFHEHSGNLGTHSDGADYHDEVPHCSSAWQWACDMGGCRKTNNALAASWKKYANPRVGDWVEEGDLITIGTSHVTSANKRFNRKIATTFEGFGSNQGNTIKTSIYAVSKISSVQVLEPLPGTILAPIGILGHRPVPATGRLGEITT